MKIILTIGDELKIRRFKNNNGGHLGLHLQIRSYTVAFTQKLLQGSKESNHI